jgi:phenylalanyl-tRNA synthetase beta chain
MALVVDASTEAGAVRASVLAASVAAAGASFSLESVRVFDLYEGKGLPEGKKSVALSLVFRSPSRTLTDDEVNGALQMIAAEVGKSGYQIRK